MFKRKKINETLEINCRKQHYSIYLPIIPNGIIPFGIMLNI